MNQTIAIYESKKSDKVIQFCTGVYQLLEFCSERQAKKIQYAANNGKLLGVWFTPKSNVRASYL